MVTHAEQAEDAINLKRQLTSLQDPGDGDFIMQDTSPPSRWDFVYSTETGERIAVKTHRLLNILEKRLPNGQPMFTARKDSAPEYRLGEVRCFLARGSREREVIDELNISPGYYCPAEHLANEGAAEIHAEKRHPTRWRQYQRHLEREEQQRDREERNAQTAAILQLAGAKAPVAKTPVAVAEKPATEVLTCPTCGKECNGQFGLQAHMRSHKEPE